MSYEFDSQTPIYLQLLQLFRQHIAGGSWAPGERVASVRELALAYGVNPNTVQRSLSELEREGLAYTERTSGRFITTETQRIAAVRDQLAGQLVERFLAQMRELGYDQAQLQALLIGRFGPENGVISNGPD